MRQTLTHSRKDSFKTCRRRHFYEYEQGIRPEQDARALRMGSVYHGALEILKDGKSLDDATESIRAAYVELPEAYDPVDWSYECETLERLLCGYVWRWAGDEIVYVANEQSFRLPLVNPATGASSTNFDWAGKIDGIIRLTDDRHAVIEHKLFGEEIEPDAPLWRRMRMDTQVSDYVLAARKLGYDVSTVYYDVTRKPTIKPTAVPILDELGLKIVLDRDNMRVTNKNGSPRQTASKEDGYELQTRPMTPEEWGEKLTADIMARPDFYYQRIEIARLDRDLEECATETWDIQKTIRDAQQNNRHYRTVNKNTCQFCAFFDLCSNGHDLRTMPSGFVRVDDLHPELSLTTRNERGRAHAAVNSLTAVAASEETTAPTASIAPFGKSNWESIAAQ